MSETPETKASNSSSDGDIDMSDGNLYTDFSNYTEPQSTTVQIKPEPQVSQPNDEKTTNEQTNKKPNRKDWIDTENPLHCKPCDFNAKDVQVCLEYIFCLFSSEFIKSSSCSFVFLSISKSPPSKA